MQKKMAGLRVVLILALMSFCIAAGKHVAPERNHKPASKQKPSLDAAADLMNELLKSPKGRGKRNTPQAPPPPPPPPPQQEQQPASLPTGDTPPSSDSAGESDPGRSFRDHILGRIIDGVASQRNRWPWSVALDTAEYGFICGGTIIDRRWILTSAHCVHGAPVTIYARIGAWNLSAHDEKDKVPVSEIIVHPLYATGRNRRAYDIALLKLIREANVNSSDIIGLPNMLFNLFELNPYCYIVGWGVTESYSTELSTILNQLWVNVISYVECQRRWDEAPLSPTVYHTNLCLDEGPDGDISACQGDSGSPLQCYDVESGQWRLAGFASWGSGACHTYPAVYTKVQSFLDWIYSTMSANGRQL